MVLSWYSHGTIIPQRYMHHGIVMVHVQVYRKDSWYVLCVVGYLVNTMAYLASARNLPVLDGKWVT